MQYNYDQQYYDHQYDDAADDQYNDGSYRPGNRESDPLASWQEGAYGELGTGVGLGVGHFSGWWREGAYMEVPICLAESGWDGLAGICRMALNPILIQPPTLDPRLGAITRVAVHIPSGDDDASSSVQAGGTEYADDEDYR